MYQFIYLELVSKCSNPFNNY